MLAMSVKFSAISYHNDFKLTVKQHAFHSFIDTRTLVAAPLARPVFVARLDIRASLIRPLRAVSDDASVIVQ